MAMTGFYSAEKTFWHSVGVTALFFPLSEWVQPPNNGGGADTADSKRRLLNLVDASGLGRQLHRPECDPVTIEDLLRVHPESYITAFREASDRGGGDLGMLAPFSQGGFEIAQLSAGLAKRAIADVMEGTVRNAYALCRPAGHHCLADTPMGFCLFANIPIAIEAAKARFGVERVAVVDWDVHHGNGTQSIYYDRSDVLTISVHQDRCFPPGYSGTNERGAGAGDGFNINLPLPAGSGHATYLQLFRDVVVPALERYRPDLIIIANGLDANGLDPLARQMLTSESYRTLTTMMVDAADRLCDGRLVAVHEGGYSEAYVPFCGLAVIEALSGIRTPVEDPELDFLTAQQPGDEVERFLAGWVDQLVREFAP